MLIYCLINIFLPFQISVPVSIEMTDSVANDTFISVLQPLPTKHYFQQSVCPRCHVLPQRTVLSTQSSNSDRSKRSYNVFPPHERNTQNSSMNSSRAETVVLMNDTDFRRNQDRPALAKPDDRISSTTSTQCPGKFRREGNLKSTTILWMPSGNSSNTKTVVNLHSTGSFQER